MSLVFSHFELTEIKTGFEHSFLGFPEGNISENRIYSAILKTKVLGECMLL